MYIYIYMCVCVWCVLVCVCVCVYMCIFIRKIFYSSGGKYYISCDRSNP